MTDDATGRSLVEPVRLVFLGGVGRSGSTLLERMLGACPQVAALGEVVHLWERGLRDDEECGCGAAFSRCPFWQEVGERAFGGWSNLDVREVLELKRRVDRTRFVPRLALPRLPARLRTDLEAYDALYERVYGAARSVAGASVVVDSSKHVSLAYCLRWSPALQLLVVHLVRDSPAVAYSWSREVRRPEASGEDALMPRYGLLNVALRWTIDNLLFEALRRSGTRVQRYRYEDVVEDPRRAVAEILAASGAGVPADALEFIRPDAVHLDAGHTVAGNPMRFRTGWVPVRRDDAWRDGLPRRRRRAVVALTQPVRLWLGYAGGRAAGRMGRAGAAPAADVRAG